MMPSMPGSPASRVPLLSRSFHTTSPRKRAWAKPASRVWLFSPIAPSVNVPMTPVVPTLLASESRDVPLAVASVWKPVGARLSSGAC